MTYDPYKSVEGQKKIKQYDYAKLQASLVRHRYECEPMEPSRDNSEKANG